MKLEVDEHPCGLNIALRDPHPQTQRLETYQLIREANCLFLPSPNASLPKPSNQFDYLNTANSSSLLKMEKMSLEKKEMDALSELYSF